MHCTVYTKHEYSLEVKCVYMYVRTYVRTYVCTSVLYVMVKGASQQGASRRACSETGEEHKLTIPPPLSCARPGHTGVQVLHGGCT